MIGHAGLHEAESCCLTWMFLSTSDSVQCTPDCICTDQLSIELNLSLLIRTSDEIVLDICRACPCLRTTFRSRTRAQFHVRLGFNVV